MQNLYVKFTVEVSNTEYSYQGQSGEAELRIQVPRSVLQFIDAGDMLLGILEAALVNFDVAEIAKAAEAQEKVECEDGEVPF